MSPQSQFDESGIRESFAIEKNDSLCRTKRTGDSMTPAGGGESIVRHGLAPGDYLSLMGEEFGRHIMLDNGILTGLKNYFNVCCACSVQANLSRCTNCHAIDLPQNQVRGTLYVI